MNNYKTSDGKSYPQSVVERKIREAKKQKLEEFFDAHGYYFCEECNRSDRKPIDCSQTLVLSGRRKTDKRSFAGMLTTLRYYADMIIK